MKKWTCVLLAALVLASCGAGNSASGDATTGEQATGEQATGEQGIELPSNMSYGDLGKDVAIKVDDIEISREDFDYFYGIVRKQAVADQGEEALTTPLPNGQGTMEEYLKHVVEEKLILQALMKRDLPEVEVTDEEINKAYEDIVKSQGKDKIEEYFKKVDITEADYKNVLAQSLYEENYRNAYVEKHPGDEKEAQAMWIAQREKLKEYKASHILVSTEEQAQDIIKQLADGADFAALAKEHSKDPGTAANGGELGYQRSEAFVDEFKDAIEHLEVGKISEPVKTKFGYHVIKVDDIRDDFDAWKERLMNELAMQGFQAHMMQMFQKSTIVLSNDNK